MKGVPAIFCGRFTKKEMESALGMNLEPADSDKYGVEEGGHGMVALNQGLSSINADTGEEEELPAGLIGYYDDEDWFDEDCECDEDALEAGEDCKCGNSFSLAIVYFGVPFKAPYYTVPFTALRPATEAEIKTWTAKVYNEDTFEAVRKGADSPSPVQGDLLN